MTKAKEWLLANGHIEAITRGRISFENHARLAKAAESGVEFSDWKAKVTTETVKDAGGNETTVTKVAKRDPKSYGAKEIVEIAPYRYNHHTHKALELDAAGNVTKVERSLREVCRNDGVSLVQCTCGAPTIVSTDIRVAESVRVEIVSKF